MPHVISILFGAAFTVAVMWAMGRLLFGRLRIRLNSLEHDLLAAVTGGALLSFSIFILCAVNAARTPVFLVLGVSALALNWRFGAGANGRFPALPALWKFLFAAPFAFYALIYLANSLAPEASPDGQTYHLGLVYRYFREHGFHLLTTNMYSNFPLGLEMLFLFAFSFGRNSAAATVHCCYLLALPLLMLNYARRIGRPRAGVCAAMIACLSPVMGIDGVSAYNDVGLATTAFALFYMLEIWREKPDKDRDSLLIPIGLVAGFCVAIKLTGFVAPLYAAAVILMRKRPKALVPVLAAAAMIFLPWPVKDWLWVGNPVSPFLNRLFPNPYIHVQFEDSFRAYFSHYDLTGLRPWFWTVTTTGELGGLIGPLFLLSPIALIAVRSPAGRHCLLAALFFIIPYPLNIGARFLIPVLPFAALGMALALEFSQAVLVLLVAGAAVVGYPDVIRHEAPTTWYIAEIPWRAALRIVPQDVFLRNRSVAWILAQTLDYYVPKGKRVWGTTSVAEAYCKTEFMVSFQSAEGDEVEDIITTANRDDRASAWSSRFTFPKRRVQHLRIAQTATSRGDLWSIGEMQIFNGQDEISPMPSWHVDAHPFPWDIRLAFDRNPATRWRSWESIDPGMHVDVDFGAPMEIDRVELHDVDGQSKVEIHPEDCDGGGCTIIPAKFDKVPVPAAGDLRKLAMRTIQVRGIDYLLFDDPNRNAKDVSRDPARWGLDFVAERAGNRLYRIQ